MRQVFIRTFGCQMNSRDSELLEGLLREKGYAIVSEMKDADIVLLNTCSVRQHAEDRAFANAHIANRIKRKRPDLIVGILGCAAQNYKERILQDFPFVDLVAGPQEIYDVPAHLAQIVTERVRLNLTSRDRRPLKDGVPAYRVDGMRAYVSITEGCDNFCSYCIVPYVRGREVSRPSAHIIDEVKGLLKRGFKDITLLGQNVNSYGKGLPGGENFVGLLEKLDRLCGKKRIRFATSHPKDVGEDLFRAMRDLESVCEHLHLPLQSGSDRILGLMNRGYTSADYLRHIDTFKKIIPRGAVTTDLIVGFPSEEETDAEQTRRMIAACSFDGAFIFKYSPRPPAASSALPDTVPEELKTSRHARLLDEQKEISLKQNARFVGMTVEVLVESVNDPRGVQQAGGEVSVEENPVSGYNCTGRTRTNKIVVFSSDHAARGDWARVTVEQAGLGILKGRIGASNSV